MESLENQKLGPNDVLIRVEAAALNPSDILFMRGLYDMTPNKSPFTPGWEGSGVVISVGSSKMNEVLLNKRVAFQRKGEMSGVMMYGGSFGEFCVTGNRCVVPLPEEISFDEGSSLFINPLTAICMVDRCA